MGCNAVAILQFDNPWVPDLEKSLEKFAKLFGKMRKTLNILQNFVAQITRARVN